MLKAFTKKTVDGVLAAFSQAIADLEQVGQENLAQAEIAAQAIRDAEARRDACRAEASRATAVAGQLKSLIQAGGVSQQP